MVVRVLSDQWASVAANSLGKGRVIRREHHFHVSTGVLRGGERFDALR
jgi:hypothetical protein